jgi:hypothetical protein
MNQFTNNKIHTPKTKPAHEEREVKATGTNG